MFAAVTLDIGRGQVLHTSFLLGYCFQRSIKMHWLSNCLIMSVSDDGLSRNTLCALKYISKAGGLAL